MYKLLIILFSFVNIYANILFNNIENIVGNRSYQINKMLIHNLFKNNKSFYNDKRNLKYEKILRILINNNLLKFQFKKEKTIFIEFESHSKAVKVVKVVKDLLGTFGFSYFYTKNIKRKSQLFNWTIKMQSMSMLNPYDFTKELNALGARVLAIRKISQYKWKYIIDVDNATLPNVFNVLNNEKLVLRKPLSAYMLKIQKSNKLQVFSRRLNKWYPHISFYDNNLNLLDKIKKQKVFKSIKVQIPQNTKYIKIDDTYTLLNIKRGLTIIVR